MSIAAVIAAACLLSASGCALIAEYVTESASTDATPADTSIVMETPLPTDDISSPIAVWYDEYDSSAGYHNAQLAAKLSNDGSIDAERAHMRLMSHNELIARASVSAGLFSYDGGDYSGMVYGAVTGYGTLNAIKDGSYAFRLTYEGGGFMYGTLTSTRLEYWSCDSEYAFMFYVCMELSDSGYIAMVDYKGVRSVLMTGADAAFAISRMPSEPEYMERILYSIPEPEEPIDDSPLTEEELAELNTPSPTPESTLDPNATLTPEPTPAYTAPVTVTPAPTIRPAPTATPAKPLLWDDVVPEDADIWHLN